MVENEPGYMLCVPGLLEFYQTSKMRNEIPQKCVTNHLTKSAESK